MSTPHTMKIIIEIAGGMVSGIYYAGATKRELPAVFVVDLDPAEVGEATVCEAKALEPLRRASDITREAVNP